ncbi:MAG: nucleotide exchange factor GrpE [Clostridiales Family XIII bacterium]|jgi:molecular chaperone GrpE|nr:nucleotide exchange factor GrpE [Clostridiales Family XIII bacterium]
MAKTKKDVVEAVIQEQAEKAAEEAAKFAAEAEEAKRRAEAETREARASAGVPENGFPEIRGQGDGDEESAEVRFLRLAADFQNYRTRTERERFERYTEGKKDFAADLLAVLDNFDRALVKEAAENTDPQFFEGMEMILRQFQDVLAKNGVKEIPALGADFDPNMHHAVMMEASKAFGSGKVSEVLQKGYALGDKVLRPAMVKVAE